MPLKLMYITNNTDIALIAENAGVDRVFVDLEIVGKRERQFGMNTVQSNHTLEDIKTIRKVLTKSELLVRSNPIYEGSEDEINTIIENGADIIMLPYFKTVKEVKDFMGFIDGRVRTCLLFETPQAVECIDEILAIDGIDEVFIGLNDLSIGYGKKFMFELLADGTVEKLCNKFSENNVPYGFGGIAGIGKGTLPAETILMEHYRLGSGSVILSRSFCNHEEIKDIEKIREIFDIGIHAIRAFEKTIEINNKCFGENVERVKSIINKIINI